MTTEKEYSTEYLRYPFTEEEKKELAQEMARSQIEAEDYEAQKKAVTADFDGQIKKAKLSASTCARKIRDGYEMRQVRCEVIKDFKKKTITIIRTDTGEEVKTRPMSVQESQMKLAAA